MFTGDIVLDLHNRLAFQSCAELNEGSPFLLYSVAIWVKKISADQCMGPC